MIDFKLLEHMLKNMTTSSKLYQLIKAEMVRRGHWKNKPRGKAFTKGNVYARRKEND